MKVNEREMKMINQANKGVENNEWERTIFTETIAQTD